MAATDAIAWLNQQLGKPYSTSDRFGPNQYDCSGLLFAFAKQLGKTIPTVTETQWPALEHIPQDQTRPGDAVFFNVFSNLNSEAPPNHVGICINTGCTKMIEAPHTGATVEIAPTDPTGWATVAGFARISGAAGDTGTKGSACLVNAPLVGCIFTRSNLKGVLGGLLTVSGGGVMMIGMLLLTAYGLKRSGALKAIGSVAAFTGPVGRALSLPLMAAG